MATNRKSPPRKSESEEMRRLCAILDHERHNRPNPEYFLDMIAWNPIKPLVDDSVPAPPAVRVGHVRWCTRGLCISLQMDEECICWRDIVNVRKLLL
ncbi:Hypothetical predicted protein [Pelobates cultripes]|uniref:Uncharacterized protein n=1 Tax=Pelobates cultripes TaxID=61616 RepID=A0AAD1VVL1_PELCU|nr:Hypothetical predicted protein [Pelobates cultripes]